MFIEKKASKNISNQKLPLSTRLLSRKVYKNIKNETVTDPKSKVKPSCFRRL